MEIAATATSGPFPFFRSRLDSFARTASGSPVVIDQTDSKAHAEGGKNPSPSQPCPLAIVLKYSRSPTLMMFDASAAVSSLRYCCPLVSMKATVSKNGYLQA